MSAAEFAEWIAFDQLEPISNHETNFMLAQQTALFAEVHRNRNAHPRPFTPAEFLRSAEAAPQRRMTAKQMEANLDMFMASHNKGSG